MLFIFSNILFPEISSSQNNEEMIEIIRDEIEDIHLDTTLKIVTLENEEFLTNMTDGGGELTGFYKGKNIYKIYRSIGISYGVGITEFYYNKNKLIFVRDKFNSYVYDEKTKSFDYTKINNTYSGSYYFDKGKIFHSNVKGSRTFKENSSDIQITLKAESEDAFNLISRNIK